MYCQNKTKKQIRQKWAIKTWLVGYWATVWVAENAEPAAVCPVWSTMGNRSHPIQATALRIVFRGPPKHSWWSTLWVPLPKGMQGSVPWTWNIYRIKVNWEWIKTHLLCNETFFDIYIYIIRQMPGFCPNPQWRRETHHHHHHHHHHQHNNNHHQHH